MTMTNDIALAKALLDGDEIDEAERLIEKIEKKQRALADLEEADHDEDEAIENPDWTKQPKFDRRVREVAARDGVGMVEAMRRARKQFPADFFALQHQPIGKSASFTYEDAVAAEIAKGFSPTVAKQRVQHAYGATLPHSSIYKSLETATTPFMNRCDEIMARDKCDRITAMRKARLEHERDFAMFQLA
jgi:hypothetical protein